MSNGEVCCILGVCCPPAEAEAALALELEHAGVSPEDAKKAAKHMLKEYDLAEAGTLTPLKNSFAKLGRQSVRDKGV